MVFATSKIIGRAPVVKFTFHGHGGRGRGTVCIVGRGDPVPLRAILESLYRLCRIWKNFGFRICNDLFNKIS